MDFIIITDTVTGKALRVIQPTAEPKFLIMATGQEDEVINKRSVGKVIRTWMKERRKEQ